MPNWLRYTLFYTTALNLIAAVLFTPLFRDVQAWAGFPDAPDLYLWSQSTFVLGMGLAYGWMAWTQTASRPLIALACFGKAAFSLTLIGCTLAGQTPTTVGLAGIPDLVLALAFGWWLSASNDPSVSA